ncbi:hypothetical protein ABW19_dt0200956 [Dactylella cylindrospora]|nr:hypothetical protein ABW19_dt0200956 [Dactylella cylindrospora]
MSTTALNGASEAFTSTASVNGGNGPSAAPASSATTSPEEIGWYFVESYYTTLNKTPDRLHLFHQKKSSFVWGTEGDNVPVSVGRSVISERIKELEFKDCKVRVTNVDSQGSINNGIVVQVLGDMTNNGEPSRRFCQTFFLAEQTHPQGYYVLNDIFRYLKDEEEEEDVEYEAPAEETAEAPVEPTAEAAIVAEDSEPEVEATEEPETEEIAAAADKEEAKEEKPEEVEVEEAPVVPADEPAEEPAEPEPEPEQVEEPVAPVPVVPAVPVVPTEATPAEPTVQPPVEPVKEVSQTPPPVPQEPPKPVKPSSWAALLQGNKPSQPAAAAPVAAPAPATTTPAPAPAPTTSATPAAPAAQSKDGWQTTESRRQNRPVSISGAPEGQTLGFVKNVTERVTARALREALSKFGAIKSLEVIHSRVCAFVEFVEPAGLIAASAANPHRVGDQNVFVEERRPRAPHGGPNRGGSAPRGGERQGSRGGSQRGPGDRDRFDSSRNSISGGRGQGGSGRGGPFSRGGRGGGAAAGGGSTSN